MNEITPKDALKVELYDVLKRANEKLSPSETGKIIHEVYGQDASLINNAVLMELIEK